MFLNWKKQISRFPISSGLVGWDKFEIPSSVEAFNLLQLREIETSL